MPSVFPDGRFLLFLRKIYQRGWVRPNESKNPQVCGKTHRIARFKSFSESRLT